MKKISWTDHHVELDDVTIHYLAWGRPSATPVLLLHGYLDLAHGWCSLGEALSDQYYIIAPHFRGHGDSSWAPGSYGYWMPHYVADWVQLLDYLGWQSCHIIGHSMGANCASILAGTYPERVRRLALVEGFGVPTWQADDAPRRLKEHIKRRQNEGSKPNKTFATREEMATRIMQSHPNYSQQHAAFLAEYSAKQLPGGRWTWKFDPRVRIPNPAMYLMEQFRAFWQRITAPTIQIIGKDSPFCSFMTPNHWNIPDLQRLAIPGTMHMVQHEAPTLFNRIIRAFLEEQDHLNQEFEM